MKHSRHRTMEEEKRTWARRQARFVLIALTLASMYGVFLILKPFFHPIILALLLSIIFAPVHRWLLKKFSGRTNIAAFCSVCIVFLLVIVPTAFFLSGLVHQGIETIQNINRWFAAQAENVEQANRMHEQYRHSPPADKPTHAQMETANRERQYSEGDGTILAQDAEEAAAAATTRTTFQDVLNSPRVQRFLNHPVMSRIGKLLERLNLTEQDVSEFILTHSRRLLEFMTTQIVPFLRAGGTIILGFILMLFVMFFFFRDGEKMLTYILHLSPLASSQEQELIDRIKRVTSAIVLGTFVTAAAQAVIAMIAFKIVGIPALFWGVMLGIASLLPVVGPSLIWVPAVIYLLLTGKTFAAIFLAIYCGLVVSSVDNFLRPYLMGGRVGMSAMMLFFAILGGIQAFGPIGFIYGPLIFGLCAVCFYIYEMENAVFLARQDKI